MWIHAFYLVSKYYAMILGKTSINIILIIISYYIKIIMIQ